MALADDRCDNDVSENSRWYKQNCREQASAIEADLVEIELLVRAKMARWAEEGILERNHRVWMGPSLNSTVKRRSVPEAIGRVVTMVRETLVDQLTNDAAEARDVAEG